MRELTSLEKKEEIKLAKKLKHKTHFNLKDILRLMEHHRQHCEILDEMEKTEFNDPVRKRQVLRDASMRRVASSIQRR